METCCVSYYFKQVDHWKWMLFGLLFYLSLMQPLKIARYFDISTFSDARFILCPMIRNWSGIKLDIHFDLV